LVKILAKLLAFAEEVCVDSEYILYLKLMRISNNYRYLTVTRYVINIGSMFIGKRNIFSRDIAVKAFPASSTPPVSM